jgi:hypothetical protein
MAGGLGLRLFSLSGPLWFPLEAVRSAVLTVLKLANPQREQAITAHIETITVDEHLGPPSCVSTADHAVHPGHSFF